MAPMPLDLPRGFRFHPKDEELIDYLKSKVCGSNEEEHGFFSELDMCECEPWDLPQKGLLTGRDQDMYFFNRIQFKYSKSKGKRTKRQLKYPKGRSERSEGSLSYYCFC